MQIKGLHKNIYRLYRYARTQECLDNYRKIYQISVDNWEEVKKNGGSDAFAKTYAGISRATYFRRKKILNDLNKGIAPPFKRPKKVNKPRWGEAEKQLVLKLRRENLTYGKEKIVIILKRDHGQTMSQSTVGRILTFLKRKGLITRSPSALRLRRKRVFEKHLKPWAYKEYKDMALGERVQIDHMTVTKSGVTIKHFQAWERKSKYIDAHIYSHAKASSAKRFLLDLVARAPFVIESVQVDGGSEFRSEFEDACSQLKIPLIILPLC